MCAAIPVHSGLLSNTPPAEGRWHGQASLLKSALQKCTRLQRSSPAVRLTLQVCLWPSTVIVQYLLKRSKWRSRSGTKSGIKSGVILIPNNPSDPTDAGTTVHYSRG